MRSPAPATVTGVGHGRRGQRPTTTTRPTRRPTASTRPSRRRRSRPAPITAVISLSVDKSVPAAELATLQNAVEAAAGYVKRSTTIFSQGQVSFAKVPSAAPASCDDADDGLREVSDHRPRCDRVPVLHLADAAQARARGVPQRRADLAARAGGAAAARCRRGRAARPRRPRSGSCERRSTSPSSRWRISSSATRIASPRRCAPGWPRTSPSAWRVELYKQPSHAGQPSPGSLQPGTKLNGRKKAAVLLVALGPERAAEIFKHLHYDEIESLSLEMAKLQHVDATVTNRRDRGARGDGPGDRLLRLGRRRLRARGARTRARPRPCRRDHRPPVDA